MRRDLRWGWPSSTPLRPDPAPAPWTAAGKRFQCRRILMGTHEKKRDSLMEDSPMGAAVSGGRKKSPARLQGMQPGGMGEGNKNIPLPLRQFNRVDAAPATAPTLTQPIWLACLTGAATPACLRLPRPRRNTSGGNRGGTGVRCNGPENVSDPGPANRSSGRR